MRKEELVKYIDQRILSISKFLYHDTIIEEELAKAVAKGQLDVFIDIKEKLLNGKTTRKANVS